MDKIVTKGLKIDLHIHSAFSNKKDGDLDKNNTIDNLPILVDKLNENGIEMCAITDHDNFNFDLYKALKGQEGNTYTHLTFEDAQEELARVVNQ